MIERLRIVSTNAIRVINGRKIRVAPAYYGWQAVDDDLYDGVEDGHTIMGTGMTEQEAIESLLEHYGDEIQ